MCGELGKRHRYKARLLLVDDHAIVRRGIEDILALEPDLDLEWEAEDASSALDVLDRHEPDLVLVDLSLTRDNGARLIREIKLRRPGIKILVLSMCDEARYVEIARRAGAERFIAKSAPTRQIVRAIREALAA